ncbi:MAG: JAB domain-containing protein [Bacillota bacterium]|nr:JAB domain-containing protein [Bacillota bacterium]
MTNESRVENNPAVEAEEAAAKKKNLHQGHRQRLKEQALSQGMDGMPAYQAMELLLFYAIPYKDTNELAHQLIDHFGSFSAVLNADYHELMKLPGVGQNTATLLTMMPEFFRFYQLDAFGPRPFFKNRRTLAEYAHNLFIGHTYEYIYMICMDAQHRLTKTELLSKGTLGSANVDPRNAVEIALRHHACFVALTHNHPAGTLKPSSQDVHVTNELSRCLDAVGITLVDHVIAAGDTCYSMAEHGYIKGDCLPPAKI